MSAPCIAAATVASSTKLWLSAVAQRVYGGGPDVVLRLMVKTLTSSAPMVAFERIGAATLAVPARLVCVSDNRKRPLLRVVK
jgi:hypothetical protein